MNKRIISLLLCFVMVFGMLATAVPAYAKTGKTVALTMTADKSEAYPGDTINYTVTLGAVEDLMGIKFKLLLPEGLTFVDGEEADGVMNALHATSAEFTPSTKVFLADPEHYTSAQDLVLMTFSCTVDAEATGDKTVQMYIDGPDNWYDSDFDNIDVIVTNKTVAVTARPVPVTGVTIDETLSVKTGESKTPSYTVNPAEATNKTVSFKSSNPAVATVNETTGEVTGVKEGTATITITTADGGFTDTCVVTVACSHANKTPVAEKDSDCKDQGWDAYSKCPVCGQLFNAEGEEIDAIPFRPLDYTKHTGGTATCTAKAICSICDQPYGDLAAHSFTAETKKAEALKSEGNCRDVAVYYYSCSVCGEVEDNDNHTFNGGKDATKHVGGTETVNAEAADHKNQVDGYTGDTKCLGCNEIIAYGTSIPAGAHQPSDNWTSDGDNHWKTCTVTDCGVEIENTKAPHSKAGPWKSDADKHWKECGVCGNTVITSTEGAHVYDQEVATEAYKASGATCTAQAVYWKSCVCGKASTTETFTSGNTAPHTPSTEWSSDGTHHWKTCTVDGCGAVIESTKTTHTESSAWNSDGDNHWKTCTVCGVKIPATEAAHAHNTAWDSNTTQHWHSCVCGDKTDVGSHVDADKNNKCDTCERNMYTGGAGGNVHNCYDFNSDGKCDTCGDKINCKHPDVNKDGYCDKCCAAIKTVESVQTFDAGIVMYAGMAVLAATGSAVVIGKKRKEQ